MARVRRLTADDAPAFSGLRLRALQAHPEAYAAAFEEERARTLAEVTGRYLSAGEDTATLGAFAAAQLVGFATLRRPSRIKIRHRATITAMYVSPEVRGTGIGRMLLRGAIDFARGWEGVTDVTLAVTVGNHGARALYVSEGFVPFGVEPRCLRVQDRFHDVEWMILHLPRGTP